MAQLLPHQVSVADAHRWRDFVAGSERRWLIQLAHWVVATKGPIEALDFTIDSLVPLWAWYLAWYRDGLPGVPDRVRNETGYAFRNDAPRSEDDWQKQRLNWSSTALSHYIAATVRRYDPTAGYQVKPIVPRSRDQFMENDTFFVAFGEWVMHGIGIPGAVFRIDDSRFSSADPARIYDIIVATYPAILERQPVPSQYDLAELSKDSVPTVEVPLFDKVQTTPEERQRAARRADPFAVILVHRSVEEADDEELHIAPPIPMGALLTMLDQIDAGDDAEPVTEAVLLQEYGETTAFEGGMSIETIAVDGTVRAVRFDAMDITKSDRTHFNRALRSLTRAANGHLIPDA